MPIYEFPICVENMRDLSTGKTAKEGDVLSVKRHPAIWGTMETSGFLIVVSEVNRPFEELFVEIRSSGKNGEKRRFSIGLNKLKDKYNKLNLARVRDRNDRYQPFLNREKFLDEKTDKYLKDNGKTIDFGDEPDRAIVLSLFEDLKDVGPPPVNPEDFSPNKDAEVKNNG